MKTSYQYTRNSLRKMILSAVAILPLVAFISPASFAASLLAGSASSGGSNYLIMSGWAQIINKNTPNKVIVQATGGPKSNILLMSKGSAQMGVVSMSVAGPAYAGKGWAKGKKYNFMRSLFGVHYAYLDGIALKKSGINNLKDLQGKTVSVGPAGGTPSLAVPPILKALGINANIVYLGQSDSINALKDGRIDAAVFFGGYPRPAYQELEASHPVNFLHLSNQDIKQVIHLNPYYTIGVIPKTVYKYLHHNARTLRDRYAYVVNKNSVSQKTAYELVKATLDHLNDFKQVHKAVARAITSKASLLTGVVIPLDPGAVKAYREAGVKVPKRLLPPSMK